MASPPAEERLRAFLTCSTRSRAVLTPILGAAEQLLLDLGWRTRVPLRPDRGSASLEERRRLRAWTYSEIERSDLVLHVASPAWAIGARLHRELAHAVKSARPVLVFVGREIRERDGIEAPEPERLAELALIARARIVDSLARLRSVLRDWPSVRASR